MLMDSMYITDGSEVVLTSKEFALLRLMLGKSRERFLLGQMLLDRLVGR